jgi:nucleotide-binding universal stress UspA family protein
MKTLDAKTRVSLENILFATDFSPAANVALPYALGIARRFGSKIYGVHARATESYVMVSPELWPSLAQKAKSESQEEASRLEKQVGAVRHEIVIEEGDTQAVLSRVIKEKDIDLIVMGTHGRGGVKKLLMGSVAEEILREAPCPVLIVGPNVSFEPALAIQMREILYATDLTLESSGAAPYGISLAQEHQAHLSLLHVLPKPGAGVLVHPEHYVDSTLRSLRNLVPPEAELWCKPEAFVMSGEPAEKIIELAEKRRVDLIVLGACNKEVVPGAATHLPIATVHKVVAHAKCPVLTVRSA